MESLSNYKTKKKKITSNEVTNISMATYKQNNNKNSCEKFRILSKIKRNFPKKRNFFSLFPPNERIIFGLFSCGYGL